MPRGRGTPCRNSKYAVRVSVESMLCNVSAMILHLLVVLIEVGASEEEEEVGWRGMEFTAGSFPAKDMWSIL